MKTLVIHPADASTYFLNVIYAGTDWTIITFDMSRKKLEEQIKAHDRIIMLGHGDSNGLFGFDKYVINSSSVFHLKQKICICIWCNANDFVFRYKLKGFYTGMIISDYEEAMLFCLYNITGTQIETSNELFAAAVRDSINKYHILDTMKTLYTGNDNPIIQFNQQNLFERFSY